MSHCACAFVGQTLRKGLSAYADPRLRDLLLTGVMLFLSFALIQQTLGFLFQDHFAMSPEGAARALGLTMMAAAITSLLGQLIVVQWLKAAPTVLIIMAIPAIGAGAVILWLADAQTVAESCGAVDRSWAWLWHAGDHGAGQFAGQCTRAGSGSGLASACPALGFILGPLVGTGLYTLDHRWPYLLVMGLTVPLAYLAWRLVKNSG